MIKIKKKYKRKEKKILIIKLKKNNNKFQIVKDNKIINIIIPIKILYRKKEKKNGNW